MAATQPTFRKLVRPRGPISRNLLPENAQQSVDWISPLNDGTMTTAPPKEAPDNQISLQDAVDQLLPSWVPDWLKDLLRSHHVRIILLILLALLVGWGLVVGFASELIAAIVIAALAYGCLSMLGKRAAAAEALREENLTAEAVANIPAQPDFVISEPGSPLINNTIGSPGTDSPEAANFRLALQDMHSILEIDTPPQAVRVPLDLHNAATKLAQAINPVVVLPNRMRRRIAFPPNVTFLKPVETLVPIMAHPSFSDPMYKPLRDISAQLMIPNLGLIPNNTVSLLETNRKFIEAYMVGLNQEMGSELLWRQYLTDLRGSFFRQFWDVGDVVNRDPDRAPEVVEEELRDIRPIHTWARESELGTHENRELPSGAEPSGNRLVLVIKGDLLRKYPTAVIFAQKARWGKDVFNRDVRLLEDANPEVNVQAPIFKAEIDPNIKFLGFNLQVNEVKGSDVVDDDNPGWFFVIQERPGEPRFGLDNPGADTPAQAREWNELAWSHLGDVDRIEVIDLAAGVAADIPSGHPDRQFEWGRNAADMAYILYQAPTMVAFHAHDMLT